MHCWPAFVCKLSRRRAAASVLLLCMGTRCCLQDNNATTAEIAVTKSGPTAPIEPNKEFTFTLTASVAQGSVSSMVLTDSIDASTGITFVRVSPDTGEGTSPACSSSLSA
jgi:hypothetical protein